MNNNSQILSNIASTKELTLRGMLLGAIITLIFTAANVYLGLKVGMTFASSIPAAVISMAVLKFFKGSNILENNMVQTQASSAGCLSSIIFVLPAMLMLGYWQGFPFWQTMLICACGGILGVIFTIPMRHALVVKSTLPYPEGVAAAEILKTQEHNATEDNSSKSGLKLIVSGALMSGTMSFLSSGLKLVSDGISFVFLKGNSIFNLQYGFSLALLGAGYLVGITGGFAMMLGTVLAWLYCVPFISSDLSLDLNANLADLSVEIWVSKVRYIGAGCIAIAALWTMYVLAKPLMEGMALSAKSVGQNGSKAKERIFKDLSFKSMALITLLMLVILSLTMYSFVVTSSLSVGLCILLVALAMILAFSIGFLVAAACGYMAGLLGSSSSPISGISIISVIIISLAFLFIGNCFDIFSQTGGSQFLTALTILTVSIVIAISAISNDNMQDLKTGYLVGATPWRQQVALIVGCVVGALVIAPVLELLYAAYGFTGAMPREGMDATQALSAPQASLMSTIAKGIFFSQLEWGYIIAGLILGAVLIVVDITLKKTSKSKLALPPLAVGIGIYLPPSIVTAIFSGGLIAYLAKKYVAYKQGNKEDKSVTAKNSHAGTLLAAGLIVGESLVGVVLALVIVVSVSTGGSENPLALSIDALAPYSVLLGALIFISSILYVFKKISSLKA